MMRQANQWWAAGVLLAGGMVSHALAAGAAVTGRLVDGTTGRPIAAVTVQVVGTGEAGPMLRRLADELGLGARVEFTGPLPEPRRGRVSRRVRSFPITPRVSLAPDERAQHWLLSVSASDRTGLLYGIARVLARNHINLQLAKVSTLGERVEDTFLVDGPALQQLKTQVRIETEILDAVAAPVA